MSYRDILVSMDTTGSDNTTAAFAAKFAADYGSHLMGVFARSQIASPFMPPDIGVWLPPQQIQELYDEHVRMVDRLADEARMTFEGAASGCGVVSDWRVTGDLKELVDQARQCDLVVLGAQKGQLDLYTPAALAIAAGGPSLIVPAERAHSDFQRVLVAWNGSREAARALHAAWPVLARANRVEVLIVSPNGLTGAEGGLERHFERHGIKPNIIIDESDDADAGHVLRRQVDALPPDLVVMGLYGRTRVHEFILGGASREMLSSSRVPLFVHH
jgi:nucleotide-binding universal stress UspA family protein